MKILNSNQKLSLILKEFPNKKEITVSEDDLKKILYLGCEVKGFSRKSLDKVIELAKSKGINLVILSNDNNVKSNDISHLVHEMRMNKFIKEKSLTTNLSSFNFTREAFYLREWNSLTTKARGLFIGWDKNDEPYIAARGYEKFFDYDDDCNGNYVIIPPVKSYIKYNGYLGILSYDKFTDDLIFCSKSEVSNDYNGKDSISWYANEFKRIFIEHTTSRYYKLIKDYLKSVNCSMVFEVLSKNDEHIIERSDEENDTIVFLDQIRNTIKFETLTCTMDLPFKRKELAYTLDENEILSFVHQVGILDKEIEGYVLTDSAGHMWKVKTKYYESWKYLRNKIIPDLLKISDESDRLKKANSIIEDELMRNVALSICRGEFNNIIEARKFYKKIPLKSSSSLEDILKLAKTAQLDSDMMRLIQMALINGIKFNNIDEIQIHGKTYYVINDTNSDIKSRIWSDFNSALKSDIIKSVKSKMKK